MRPNWSRRAVLRASAVPATAGVAGCGGIFGSGGGLLGGTKTPPAAYDLVVENTYDETQTVRVEVLQPFEGTETATGIGENASATGTAGSTGTGTSARTATAGTATTTGAGGDRVPDGMTAVMVQALRLESGASKRWEGLISEEVQHAVVAKLLSPVKRTEEKYRELTYGEKRALGWDNLWIEPGSDTAPPVSEIRVVINTDEVNPPEKEASYGNSVDVRHARSSPEGPEVTETSCLGC